MTAFLPLAAFVFALGGAAAATIVPFESTSHDSGLSTPIRNEPRTLQMVFASSLLSPIGNGSLITGISFRLYGGTSFAWPLTTALWENYDIYLSSSLNSPGSLSPNFDENMASDAVLVRSGELQITVGSFPAGNTPNDFGLTISFTVPYVYTSTDLLITIRHSGNGTAGDAPLESTAAPGPYQLLTGSGYDAMTGSDNEMLVTQLVYSTTPEPSAMVLFAAGSLLIGGRRRRWSLK